MHIALLFYGRIQSFRQNFDNIFDSIGRQHTVDVFLSSDDPHKGELKEFVELYTPKKICVDPVIHQGKLFTYPGRNTDILHDVACSNVEKHYINKKRVFSLLESYSAETGTTYDLVVSTRLDIHFNTPLHLELPQENTIYIPNLCDFVENGINDQVAYGNVSVMKRYMLIYDTMFYILDNFLAKPNSEMMHLANLRLHGIQIVRTPVVYEFTKRQVAIVLTGAVSKKKGGYGIECWNESVVQAKDNYVNFKANWLGIKKNIIDANPDYLFEIYICCWNPDLENEIRSLYSPCKAIFESNDQYKPYIQSLGGYFSIASHALSMKKGFELAEQMYKNYQYFIWDRLDTLLLTPIKLSDYDPQRIYTLTYNEGNADSFFVMNLEHAKQFKYLIDSAQKGNTPAVHSWIKKYVTEYMKCSITEANVFPGKDYEIIRKLYFSYNSGQVTEEQLKEYDLSVAEILSYS